MMQTNKQEYSCEIDMYPDIIESMAKKMEFLGYEYTIYKTWKEFSPGLKEIYPNVISILNKDVLPDLTVIYKNKHGEQKCLIIEVKLGQLILKDIAQAKMYGDIFDADSVLLVSLKKIRKSFIEFYLVNQNYLKCANGSQLYTCILDNKQLQLQNPFPLDGGIIK